MPLLLEQPVSQPRMRLLFIHHRWSRPTLLDEDADEGVVTLADVLDMSRRFWRPKRGCAKRMQPVQMVLTLPVVRKEDKTKDC